MTGREMAEWPDREWSWDARIFGLIVLIAYVAWLVSLFMPIVQMHLGAEALPPA
jgi:uncharacterized membrane protein (GlpM family)